MSAELIVLQKRKINVVNVGGKNFTHESTATSRGELETELGRLNMGITFNQKKVIIGETKNSLDVPGALLPSSNFTLFIMPQKTKAGGDARNKVKELMKKYPMEARTHFSQEKSYTVKKDAELEELLKTWVEPDDIPAPKVKEKVSGGPKRGRPAKDTGIADVVTTVEDYKIRKEQAKDEMMDQDTLKLIHALVVDNSKKLDRILEFVDPRAGMKMMPQQTISEGVYSEAVHQLENGEVDSVMRQIQREFPDVKS